MSNELDEINGLDDIFGPLTIPEDENTVHYRIRELIEYARLKGKEPEDLTPEEVAMFANK